MTRIGLMDTGMDAILKMVDGNPGAISVCCALIKQASSIDPQNILGGLGVVLSLDTLGIYGPEIWMLFKYVCKQKIENVVCLLRAWQLGIISENGIKAAIRGDEKINWTHIYTEVKERLPEFKGEYKEVSND